MKEKTYKYGFHYNIEDLYFDIDILNKYIGGESTKRKIGGEIKSKNKLLTY